MLTRTVATLRGALTHRLFLVVFCALLSVSTMNAARAACVPVIQQYQCAGGLCVGCPNGSPGSLRACGEAIYAGFLQSIFGPLHFDHQINDVGDGIYFIYSVPAGNYSIVTIPAGTRTDCPEIVRNLGPKQCPAAGGPVFSNPINVGIGNKLQVERDYTSAGVFPLSFARYYNSKAPLESPTLIGQRWTHQYARRIDARGLNAASVRVLRADGEVVFFAPCSTGYCGGLDEKSRLTRTTNSQGYTTAWQLVDENDVVESYDGGGRLLSEKSRAGVLHTLAYDSSGHLVTVTDSFGRQLALGYDGSGRINQVTEPGGAAIVFAYDSSGNLSSVTYPDSSNRTYLYDESGHVAGGAATNLLTGIMDESGTRFASYNYDSDSRAIDSQHAGAVEHVQVTYNANGSSTVTDPLGTSRTFGIQTVQNVTHLSTVTGSVCSTCSLSASYGYNAGGDLTSLTDFRGNQTLVSFNARHLEEGRTEANGASTARTTTATWHASYRLPLTRAIYAGSTATGTPIRTSTFTHDVSGNVLTRTDTDTLVTPNVSRTWTSTYDSYGRVLTVDGPRTDASDITSYTYYTCTTGLECGQLRTTTNALFQTTTYNTYNAHGQPLTITDANGVVTTLTYDLRQRLASRVAGGETTTFEYWPTGLLKKTTNADGSYVLYTYDAAHRLTRLEDGDGNRIEYTLDAIGNQTAENHYDPSSSLSRARTQVYNSLGQLWKQVGSSGTTAVTTTFGYDSDGNQTSVNAPLSRNTAQFYDELSRLKQITDPGTGVTQFAYDANDNLTTVTDPKTNVTTYAYNGFGDVTQTVSPDTGTTANTYDSAGNLATTTDARSKQGTFGYDALNRVTSITYPDRTLSFTYDAGTNGAGRLTGASDANHSLAWSYDSLGRVISKGQTVGSVTKTVGYGYSTGNLTSLVTPSGQTISYGYSNGRISSVTLNGSTTILSGVIHDPFGPIVGWTWGNSTLAARVYDLDGNLTDLDSASAHSYHYDNAFRITGIDDLANSAKSWTYGYDSLDRLTAASTSSTSMGFTYDANGNRLTRTGSGAASYTVPSTNNRVTAISGTPSRTYSYDAAGNVSSYTGAVFSYTDFGRLGSATVGGTTTSYTVNALGQRVRKSNATSTRVFVYDEAAHLLGEYDGSGALVQETVWLEDVPVATLRPNGGGGVNVYYVHTDQLNAPRSVSRPSDNVVVWRWDSEPFGSDAANADPDGDGVGFAYGLRFPGQYYDSESGQSYNYFRDYDPATGRYIESDPIGLEGGINTYAYASGNPVRWIDPDGLDVAVVENGPTSGNPIGHTAVAVTGAGVYSYGNGTPAGSSLGDYLRREAPRRDTKVYVVKTTPEQDAEVLAYFRQYKNTSLPGDFLSKYFADNCSIRSNGALDAASVPVVPAVPGYMGPSTPPLGQPGTAGMRAMAAGATVISIPRGTTTMPPQLLQFEPR